MSKRKKNWLIAAACCVGLGCLLIAVGLAVTGGDWESFSTVRYATRTYSVDVPFSSVEVLADSYDVVVSFCDGESAQVICPEDVSVLLTDYSAADTGDAVASSGNDTLSVRREDARPWYTHIGVFVGDAPEIRICLPKKDYESVQAASTGGSITLPQGLHAERITLETRSGCVTARDFAAQAVKIETDSGDVSVFRSTDGGEVSVSKPSTVSVGPWRCRADTCQIATNSGAVRLSGFTAQTLRVTTDSGTIDVRGCEAAAAFLQSGSGDITGSVVSATHFRTETGSGDVSVPDCPDARAAWTVTTGSGDICFVGE